MIKIKDTTQCNYMPFYQANIGEAFKSIDSKSLYVDKLLYIKVDASHALVFSDKPHIIAVNSSKNIILVDAEIIVSSHYDTYKN